MDEDQWAEEVIRKHMRRSGIRRLYCFDTLTKAGHLELEVVIRGKVLKRIKLWSVPPLF